MRTYWVKVDIPTYYHINAESKQEAAQQATEQYKQEHNTAENPQVLEVDELDEDDELAETICQGPSCRDELRYMRKRW
jgi:hypothetical protein